MQKDVLITLIATKRELFQASPRSVPRQGERGGAYVEPRWVKELGGPSSTETGMLWSDLQNVTDKLLWKYFQTLALEWRASSSFDPQDWQAWTINSMTNINLWQLAMLNHFWGQRILPSATQASKCQPMWPSHNAHISRGQNFKYIIVTIISIITDQVDH